MAGATRRRVLLSALAGPVLFAPENRFKEPSVFPDFEGRAIQRVDESSELSPHEREHIIEIEIPETVKVGEPFQARISMPHHPKSGSHHIMWMRVFVDKQMVSYMTFAPEWVRPATALTLELPPAGRIEVLAECNLHAIWGKALPLDFDFEG